MKKNSFIKLIIGMVLLVVASGCDIIGNYFPSYSSNTSIFIPSFSGLNSNSTSSNEVISSNNTNNPDSSSSVEINVEDIVNQYINNIELPSSIRNSIIDYLPNTLQGMEVEFSCLNPNVISKDGLIIADSNMYGLDITIKVTLENYSKEITFSGINIIMSRTSIAEIIDSIKLLPYGESTEKFELYGTIVAKDSGNRPYLMDENGDVILVYNNQEEIKSLPIGSKISILGSGTIRYDVYQFGTDGIELLNVETEISKIDYGRAINLTAKQFHEDVYDAQNMELCGKYLRITGGYLVQATAGYINLAFDNDDGIETIIHLYSNPDLSYILNSENVYKEVVVYGYSYGRGKNNARICPAEVVFKEDDKYDDVDIDLDSFNKVSFDFGENGEESHKDGMALEESQTFQNGEYKLELTNLYKVYGHGFNTAGQEYFAQDAKGNSCLKIGTSSSIGSFNFKVDDEVKYVIIYVAKYKTRDLIVVINYKTYEIDVASNDGEYMPIIVDTSEEKEIFFATVEGTTRCMIDKIELYYEEKD
ncbi:MAG: hypothetical protein IJV94_01890 [Bacilli bacterium]|nr:hypothetical protein [Bacilli bacterium]